MPSRQQTPAAASIRAVLHAAGNAPTPPSSQRQDSTRRDTAQEYRQTHGAAMRKPYPDQPTDYKREAVNKMRDELREQRAASEAESAASAKDARYVTQARKPARRAAAPRQRASARSGRHVRADAAARRRRKFARAARSSGTRYASVMIIISDDHPQTGTQIIEHTRHANGTLFFAAAFAFFSPIFFFSPEYFRRVRSLFEDSVHAEKKR